MTAGALQTLFLPFREGSLLAPASSEQWLFLGAEASASIDADWIGHLTCVQPFRPDYLALRAAGLAVEPRPVPGKLFDGALLLIGKHRGRNEDWLAEALRQVKPGGMIVICGHKKLGIESLRKTAKAIAPIGDSLSKNHAVVFWFRRPEAVDPAALDALALKEGLLDGRFVTAPGMFSHSAIDKGSAMLVRHFAGRIAGHVADFGAAWGYLGSEVLNEAGKLKSLSLYEADFEALEAAKRNVGTAGVPVNYHWHDVIGEPITETFDTIVMNPPFHAGRGADPSLGQAFIAAAAKRLKPGGRLLLVANRQMPYETGLKAQFRSVQSLEDNSGYKVMEARK